MNAKQFFTIVSQMRQAQKDYFKTRDKEVLNKSIKLERQVDEEIDRVNKILSNKQYAKQRTETRR